MEAETEAKKASDLGLKNAVRMYGDLYRFSALRKKAAAPYLAAVLLFALREKEIGISNAATVGLRESPDRGKSVSFRLHPL